MYTIHTTPGFIISSRPSGEAGRLLSIFTKDFGLIRVIAEGTRFEKSKLRPFIQDYTFGVFSFVRGKEFWRLTNAQEIISADIKNETKRRIKVELVARVALLLGRLLQGENPHPELFETLDKAINSDMITKGEPRSVTDLSEALESLIVIRILHRLGYVAVIPEIKSQIESDEISTDILVVADKHRILINQHINKALKESHL